MAIASVRRRRGRDRAVSSRSSAGSPGRPCATLRSTFHARAGAAFPVTGPASGGPERGTGASTRATGTQGAVGAILVVLALGLALRLIIAYLLPGSGFEADLISFRFWADNLAREGLSGFYERDFFHDYTPGLPVRPVARRAGRAWPWAAVGDLIKVPPVLADLAIGWLVWSMVRELGGRERLALGGRRWSPCSTRSSWFDSVVWGQVDSFGVVFLLLALRSLVARSTGARGDLHGHRRDHQAAARHPRPARRRADHPAGLWPVGDAQTGVDRRLASVRRARAAARLGAADRPLVAHPDHRCGRAT